MSFVAAAITAVAATTLYSADQAQKASYRQRLAVDEAAAENARKTAEAETGAQVAANAKLADAKRRRRSSALGLGDTATGDALGGPATVLAAGGPAPAARAAAGAAGASAGSALGAGAPSVYRGGEVGTPRTPARGVAF